MNTEREHFRFSEALDAAKQAACRFSYDLNAAWNGLSPLDGGSVQRPDYVVAWALYAEGGILCAPLYYLGFADPRAEDSPALDALANAFAKVYEIAQAVTRILKLPVQYLNRFEFRLRELFSADYFARHFVPARKISYAEYRQRILRAASRAVRSFLEWLCDAFVRLRAAGGVLPADPIVVAPQRQTLVEACDRARGLVILKNPCGRDTRAFNVPPGRERVWAFMRLLVETPTPEGDVVLPRDYAAHFRNTNAQNDLCHDDLERLVRHIHPSLTRKHHYHLAWEAKPPLLRDR